MANILGILFIILIAALVAAIILAFLKKITKMAIPLIIIALLIVGAFYFVSDTADLQRNFAVENKIFLLDMDGKIAGAFVSGADEQKIITELEKYNRLYPNNMDEILGNYYKVIIVHWDAFSEIKELDMEVKKLSQEEIKNLLSADNPMVVLEEGPFKGMFESGNTLKSVLFSWLFAEENQKTNLIVQYRKGVVDIYPETTSLKVIKLIPEPILERLVKVE